MSKFILSIGFAFCLVLFACQAPPPSTPFAFPPSATVRVGVLGVTPVPLAPGDTLNVQATGGNLSINGTPLASGNIAIAAITWTPTIAPTLTSTPTASATGTTTRTATSTASRTSTPPNTLTPIPPTQTPTPHAVLLPFISIWHPAPTPTVMVQIPFMWIRVTRAGSYVNDVPIKVERCAVTGSDACSTWGTWATSTTYDVPVDADVYPGSSPWTLIEGYWWRVTVGANAPFSFYWTPGLPDMYQAFYVQVP